MIQYIYFVKCPNCEDEPFDFFDEAKEYALGCLSDKPVITQVEVNRNDFGECVDSSDLGTVWSWEELMSDVPAEDPAVSVFTKDDFAEYDPDCDPEFDDSNGLLDTVPDNFRRPIPDGMSIESIVEEMEENEDTVECVCCQELYPKEECKHDKKHGWICPDCADEVVECTWCEELYNRSGCRYEVDLGWLCDRCEAAIKSRGETLTFREGSYWDFLDEEDSSSEEGIPLKEAAPKTETVELDYDSITTEIVTKVHPATYRDPEETEEEEVTDSFTYEVDAEDIATTIWENFITEEDVVDVPGGLEALEDDSAWQQFLETHFDTLVEKYYNQLLDHYRDDATEAAREKFQADFDNYEPDYDDYDESVHVSKAGSLIETLEEGEDYKARLSMCPECGENSFDLETGICINCGFNIV